eukprot:761792-Hanusia_phi.AAC.3
MAVPDLFPSLHALLAQTWSTEPASLTETPGHVWQALTPSRVGREISKICRSRSAAHAHKSLNPYASGAEGSAVRMLPRETATWVTRAGPLASGSYDSGSREARDGLVGRDCARVTRLRQAAQEAPPATHASSSVGQLAASSILPASPSTSSRNEYVSNAHLRYAAPITFFVLYKFPQIDRSRNDIRRLRIILTFLLT